MHGFVHRILSIDEKRCMILKILRRWKIVLSAQQEYVATAPGDIVQIGGGSEFECTFEEVCKNYGIKLFVLPLRLPKLNGYVERANRTHTEEFYEVTDASFEMDVLNKASLKGNTSIILFAPINHLVISHPKSIWSRTLVK